MFFPVLITACILIGGWSFLSVLGNERQSEVQSRERGRTAATSSSKPNDSGGGAVSH